MKKKEIPWGRTLTTNDAFLGSHKTGSKKTRPVVVIETYEDELAVVPLSTTKGSNRTELKGYKNKKTGQITYYKHYLEIEDNEGNPIKVNGKFRENHKNMDVAISEVNSIRTMIFTKARTKQHNQKMRRQFLSRNSKKK